MSIEKKGSRKEWVKNIAIIFLSIMLVLTFFSNTIMNYSLPEVATTVIEPGSITAKIRGTGTLTSDDPYRVVVEESRVISSVAVKAGDRVEKDQIIFYLEDKESTELLTAEEELAEEEKTLNDLMLAFSNEILKGEITNQSYQNIQNGNISSNNEYQARITAAKQKVDSAKATADSLSKQESIAGTSSSSLVEKEAQLAAARTELETAMADLSAKEGQLKEAEALAEQDLAGLMKAKQEADTAMTIDADELDNIISISSNNLSSAIQSLASNAGLTAPTPVKRYEEVGNIDTYMKNINNYLKEAEKLLNEANKKNGSGGSKEGQLKTELEDVKEAIAATQNKYEMLAAAKATYQNASQKADAALKAAQKISSLKSAVNSAGNYVNECQARVTALTNEINNSTAGQNKQKADISVAKINAEANLKQAEEELAQLLKDISGELNLDNQNDLISRQREKVAKKQKEIEKLRENAVGAVIKAPVAGFVSAVNVMAGDKTEPAKELAVMQPDGKGFSMSFSVTAEQAKKVNVGELAEIQNSWFYSDIEATLTGIRPDPENPGEKKLLVFDVKGDVQAGQSISLSIGQKSMDYDLLVPNSAVREDNQGKFILLVESKNSPLGNRYIAKRVDVEVLGADDLKTAINAPINSYEYVITTATQPVEAGKQVRLAETD